MFPDWLSVWQFFSESVTPVDVFFLLVFLFAVFVILFSFRINYGGEWDNY